MNETFKIGITDGPKYENYYNWVQFQIPGLEVVKLSWRLNNLAEIASCNCLLMTGGEDVHPRFYHHPEYMEFLEPGDISEKRDIFELDLLREAFRLELPILGICRGLQIINVFLEGTLIPDIPRSGKKSIVHTKRNGVDGKHLVTIAGNSLLSEIAQTNLGEVNSSHHQSADIIAPGLKVSALSEDGIVEALEWNHPENKPFLLLVQWHPERMENGESRFSHGILRAFLENARYKNLKTNR